MVILDVTLKRHLVAKNARTTGTRVLFCAVEIFLEQKEANLHDRINLTKLAPCKKSENK
jgi:hypothetical protein